jgi:hypothetical protein
MSFALQVALGCDACGAAPVLRDDILCAACRERVRARAAARRAASRPSVAGGIAAGSEGAS